MRNRFWMPLALIALCAATAWAAGPGDLDTTFDGDGVVEASDGAWVSAVAVQADEKVLVAGTLHASQLTEGDSGWLIRRYTATGALDATFGSGGEATPFDLVGGARGIAHAILDGSGRILASGEALVEVAVQTGKGKNKTWTTELQRHAVVIRLTSSGALDAAFGDGGVAQLDGAGLALPIAGPLAIQSDGKIVVLGSGQESAGKKNKRKGGAGSPPNEVLFLGRLLADGTLDTSFGEDGYATQDLGHARALAVQSDDALVVGSQESDEIGAGGWAIVRFDADGQPDAGFGTVTSPEAAVFYHLSEIVIDGDDRIVAGGLASHGGTQDGVVVRYDPDGTLHAGFGSGGIAPVGLAIRNEGRGGLAVQADGAVLLAGTIVDDTVTPPDLEAYLVRFTADGDEDVTFGAGGFGASLPIAGPHAAQALALAPSGDVVVAGLVEDYSDEAGRKQWVARWLGD